MTECKFALINNKLTAISGADEGDYDIVNNSVTIKIGGVDTIIDPFDKDEIVDITDNVLTINATAPIS